MAWLGGVAGIAWAAGAVALAGRRAKRPPNQLGASLCVRFGFKAAFAVGSATDRQDDSLALLLAGLDVLTGTVSGWPRG